MKSNIGNLAICGPRENVCIFVFAIVQCHFAIIVIFRQKLLMIKEIAYD